MDAGKRSNFCGVSGVIYYKYCKTQSSVLRISEKHTMDIRKIELNFSVNRCKSFGLRTDGRRIPSIFFTIEGFFLSYKMCLMFYQRTADLNFLTSIPTACNV